MIIAEAGLADCGALARTSQRAFDADTAVGAPGPGGPPGYDSAEWHQAALGWGQVFSITHAEEIVGGAIVFLQSPTQARLARIWLVPEAQNQGLGREAMTALESRFQTVTRWTLDTPAWNTRNHHFYARCGYRVIGREGEDGVLFEKLIETHSTTD
jgi:RimJ/RimL family protein N-acetyltransferase